MYAIIETGGKQYQVEPGTVFPIERLKVEPGETIEFDKVLFVNDEGSFKIGTPYLETAKVFGTVIENGKHPKVITFKFKSKKDYRKKQGHRQPYTLVEIGSMIVDGKETVFKKDDKAAVKEASKDFDLNEDKTEKAGDIESKSAEISVKDSKSASSEDKAGKKSAAKSAKTGKTAGAKEEE
jgi:large subunit ribosomal protein L21